MNEFFFYIHELAGTAKNIFPKEKILPNCNAERTARQRVAATFFHPPAQIGGIMSRASGFLGYRGILARARAL
jgi:hypothetical protein